MGGGGNITGIAMALILASRYLGPMMRSIGPGGRHITLVSLAVVLPLGIGARVWHERREKRAIAAASEKRRRAKSRRLPSGSGTAPPAGPPGMDGGAL